MNLENDNIVIEKKKGLTVERVLLSVILVLQTVILVFLLKDHGLLTPKHQVVQHPAFQSPVSLSQLRQRQDMIRNSPMPRHISHIHGARRMFDEMDQMFASAINDLGQMGSVVNLDDGWDALMASPAMDMKERDNSYVVVFSLPGARPSDVNVSLEGPILTVTTSVRGEAGLKDQIGMFKRAIQLPGPVGDASQAQAVLTNGILRVSVPKAAGSNNSSFKESKRLL